MDFFEKVKKRKEAYTGEIVREWLQRAYQLGIDDLQKEMKQRLEIEAKENNETQAGIFRAIGILEELDTENQNN